MKDFLSNIASLYWWISVVVVGVLINLASAYMKNRLDERLSGVSTWWRIRSETRKAEREKEIKELQGNSQEQIMLAFDSLRHGVRGLLYLVASLLAFVFVGVVVQSHAINPTESARVDMIFTAFFFALGSIAALMSYLEDKSAIYKYELLMDARRRAKTEIEA